MKKLLSLLLALTFLPFSASADTQGITQNNQELITEQDGKVCIANGGVQECLSTCGIAMDGATMAAGATIVAAPAALGTAAIGAGCDFSNGLIYFFKGEKIQAGASMFAVIPIVGMVGKPAGQVIKLSAKEAAEVAAQVAAKEAAERATKEAAEKAVKVGVGKITIEPHRLKHVLDRHAAGGIDSAGNSIFSKGENIAQLIANSEKINPIQQSGGNFQRIVDAGRMIGIDKETGKATSIYTVITNELGNLVTTFPGIPSPLN